jgi:NAD(P)-dependent dehydrogenase (short-subunit alcohol dehydrogenase family)
MGGEVFLMKTFLVTGSNRGIGLELCRQLKARGEDVIAACRSSSPELETLDVRVATGVDVTSAAAVTGLLARLDDVTIDGLILNAGILEPTSLEPLDLESLRRQFEVNALGPLRLTRALLTHLSPAAKVVLITSRMGSIGDNSSGGSYGYRMSKAALNMAGKSLAVDLRPHGIAVAILHPGLVRTRMVGFNPQAIDPEEAVRGLLARIDGLTLENSGTFWHANGDVLPW